MGIPGVQVFKIDIAVFAGVDHFHKIRVAFEFIVDVHDLFGVFRPFHDQGLSCPAAARPIMAARVLLDAACALFPYRRQRAFLHIGCAVAGKVAEVVAPEGNNAFESRIILGFPEVDSRGTRIITFRRSSFKNLGRQAQFGGLCFVDGGYRHIRR